MTAMFASATYRDGVLYAAMPESIQAVPKDFVRSTGDGATWTRVASAPSTLERSGWGMYAFAADYSAPQSWYRTLAKAGGAPMLEHSSDDGRTWSTLGSVSSLRSLYPPTSTTLILVTLATTPQRPNALCTALDEGGWLTVSADGGRTWRDGPPPATVSNVSGYAPTPVQMGSDGTCYVDFNYQPATSASTGRFLDMLLRLAPGAVRSSPVTLSPAFYLEPAVSASWWYEPGGHGLSARLVIFASSYDLSPAQYLTVLGEESTASFLLWSPVS
jgi:hypothetical protein